MRGHNILLCWEIRKIISNYPQYPLLSGALSYPLNVSKIAIRMINSADPDETPPG